MSDYIKGANKELYGLQLNKSYNGMSFTSAAKEVYKSSSIMLIAAQDSSGNVVMNPGSKYEISDSSVFFCIANDEDSLDEIRRDKGLVFDVACLASCFLFFSFFLGLALPACQKALWCWQADSGLTERVWTSNMLTWTEDPQDECG